jgi:hypothetical protein
MDDFTTQVLGFSVKAKDNANGVGKSLASQGLSGMVRRSPVDTGRFKGNWRVGINQPDLRFNKDLKDKAGSNTINRGNAAINKAPDNAKIYATNITPYGPLLEAGRSPQAPPGGIVAVTINDMRASVNRTAAEIKRSQHSNRLWSNQSIRQWWKWCGFCVRSVW